MKQISVILAFLLVSVNLLAQNRYPLSKMYYNMDTSRVVVVGRLDFVDTINRKNPRKPNYVTPREFDSVLNSVPMNDLGVKFCKSFQLPLLTSLDPRIDTAISRCIKEYIRRTKLFNPRVLDTYNYESTENDMIGIQLLDSSGLFVHISQCVDTLGESFLHIEPEQNLFMNNWLTGLGNSMPQRCLYGCFYIDGLLCILALPDEKPDSWISSLFVKNGSLLTVNLYRPEVEILGIPFGHYSINFYSK